LAASSQSHPTGLFVNNESSLFFVVVVTVLSAIDGAGGETDATPLDVVLQVLVLSAVARDEVGEKATEAGRTAAAARRVATALLDRIIFFLRGGRLGRIIYFDYIL